MNKRRSRASDVVKPSYSAVLLAGGKSRRMGRDKALLPLADANILLWQRQLSVLRELQPEEIFWSGEARPNLPKEVRIIADAEEEAGPLGGICACLSVMRTDLLIVLAIDLPEMTAEFLRRLLSRSTNICGMVAQNGEFFEPLAGVYPKAMSERAKENLQNGHRAMQGLIREAVKGGLMQTFHAGAEMRSIFKNVNYPTDWDANPAHSSFRRS